MDFRSVCAASGLLAAATLVAGVSAQPVFRGTEIFPPEEFAARRANVMAQIGDAAAIVLGTTEPPGEMPFRQNSQFFYLTGVAEPRAIVIIDGRTKQTTVFLQPADARRDTSMFGPALAPSAETATALGVDAVLPRAEFTAAVAALARDRRTIYTPFAAEVLGSQSQGDPTRLWTANKAGPWDGRDSREATFIARLKPAAPQSEIKNLDPILNALRAVKSPREIAIIREATRIAGLGHHGGDARRPARACTSTSCRRKRSSCSRSTARWAPSYFALIATGTNTYYTHYNRNTAMLADGDLVQFDYAPDFKYYQSDVTRVFPANGTFTPRQREMLRDLPEAVSGGDDLDRGAQDAAATSSATAVTKMDAIMASYPFTDDASRRRRRSSSTASGASADARSLGHNVGLEVHDVGGLQADDLRAGPDLHHRAADAHRGRAPRHPARGHDPDHRDAATRTCRLRADRGERHREADGGEPQIAQLSRASSRHFSLHAVGTTTIQRPTRCISARVTIAIDDHQRTAGRLFDQQSVGHRPMARSRTRCPALPAPECRRSAHRAGGTPALP